MDLMQTKPSDAAFSAVFRTSISAGDVISGIALDYLGTHVPASVGDSRLNNGRIIRLFVRPGPVCALLCRI